MSSDWPWHAFLLTVTGDVTGDIRKKLGSAKYFPCHVKAVRGGME